MLLIRSGLPWSLISQCYFASPPPYELAVSTRGNSVELLEITVDGLGNHSAWPHTGLNSTANLLWISGVLTSSSVQQSTVGLQRTLYYGDISFLGDQYWSVESITSIVFLTPSGRGLPCSGACHYLCYKLSTGAACDRLSYALRRTHLAIKSLLCCFVGVSWIYQALDSPQSPSRQKLPERKKFIFWNDGWVFNAGYNGFFPIFLGFLFSENAGIARRLSSVQKPWPMVLEAPPAPLLQICVGIRVNWGGLILHLLEKSSLHRVNYIAIHYDRTAL